MYKSKNEELNLFYFENPICFRTYLISLLLAFFVVSVPIIVLINLLIFVDYLRLIIFGFVVCVSLFYMLYKKFLIDGSIDNKGYSILYLMEGGSLLIFLTILYFISWIWW